MQIFDLKVVESLGLPVEVINGVPCIVAGDLNFSIEDTQTMDITVPEHTVADFYDALTSFLGVCIVDGTEASVMITNVSKNLLAPVARGLFLPNATPLQRIRISYTRYVGVQRKDATTITIFVAPVEAE